MCIWKWLNTREGEEEFEIDRRCFPRGLDYLESVYVKVDEAGHVVEAGTRLWGREGFVHFLGLPWLYGDHPHETFIGQLSQTVGSVVITISVDLMVVFSTATYDYQQLYDTVVRGGFDHIGKYIVACFQKAALANPAVVAAFTAYAEHERPVLFVEELSQALKALDFTPASLGINAIERIEACVDLNTVTASLRVTYSR